MRGRWMHRLRTVVAVLAVPMLMTGIFTTASMLQTSLVQAQEDEGEDGGAAAKEGDGGAAAEGGGGGSSQPEQTWLGWFIGALGWQYTIAFLFLSFSLVALIVMNFLGARRDAVVPIALVENFEQYLKEKRYQEAYELAKNDDSFLGRVLAAGLAKLSAGYAPAIEAMQEVGEEENMKLEHRLSYVALIGTLSPMVGLLGTVHGMIMSFDTIARSTTQPKPAELAKGISTALVTTIVGLMLAIPAIGIHGILKNRVSRLVLEVGILSESLMSRFSSLGKKA